MLIFVYCDSYYGPIVRGSLDSVERGTVEWNSGMVERWNTGMVERAINDPVPFFRANWACALAIDVEKHGMVWIPGYLLLEIIDISTS